MTIAAVYARKSTDQSGVADEQKSVARQVEHARAYAAVNGWSVDNRFIFVDDGISGAEFDRPALLQLMNALKPRPPFQVLIVSDLDRLGRESVETSFVIKQLSLAGVRIFVYLENREIRLDSPIDALITQVQAFGAAIERQKAAQRVTDTFLRKAKAGHVCGGRVFGYDSVSISDPNGRRSHVERRVNDIEAAIVRRIFELAASGLGFTSIAKRLNADAAPSPRPQQGRPAGWAPSSVREVLNRPLYRGEITYNKTKKRNAWGQTRPTDRPATEWVAVNAPALAIVSAELWSAAHAQMDQQRARYHKSPHGGVPWSAEARYLFSGLLRCSECGAGFEARSRPHGAHRVVFYGCSAYHRRGRTVCSNSRTTPLALADPAILSSLELSLLNPAVLQEAVQRVVVRLSTPRVPEPVVETTQRLAALERELDHLEAAVIAGGADVQTLVSAMRTREAERHRLVEQLTPPVPPPIIDSTAVLHELDGRLCHWRSLLREHPSAARRGLKQLIMGRLDMAPDEETGGYRFRGRGTLQPLITGLIPGADVAPPSDGSGWGRQPFTSVFQ